MRPCSVGLTVTPRPSLGLACRWMRPLLLKAAQGRGEVGALESGGGGDLAGGGGFALSR